jgi:hypothetical protein
VSSDTPAGDARAFREVLSPTVRAIGELAAAVLEMAPRKGHIPGRRSRAKAELVAQRQRYSEVAGWDEPVTDAHVFGGFTLLAATDYAQSFADLFAAGPPPVYAHLVLARAVLEACVVSAWLNDATVDVDERVRRALCEHLYSAMEVKRLGITDDLAERVSVWKTTAKALGWDATTPHNRKPTVGGSQRPSTADGIDALLTAGRPVQIGKAQWSYLSSVSHVTRYGLSEAISRSPGAAPTDGPTVADVWTKSTSVQLQAWCILRALKTAADARFALMGWRDEEWLAVCQQADAHGMWLFAAADSALRLRGTGAADLEVP